MRADSKIWPDLQMLRLGWACKCPQCQKAGLYPSRWSLELKERCEECGLELSRNDTADGPAVFLIFILGTLLVPLALWLDALFNIPLWLHAVVWMAVALFLTVGSLRPIKAYIVALQFKHRPNDWKE